MGSKNDSTQMFLWVFFAVEALTPAWFVPLLPE